MSKGPWDKYAPDAQPASASTGKPWEKYAPDPSDWLKNTKGEGTYKMTGKDGKMIPVPYSAIADATKLGYVMDMEDRKKFETDSAADPHLKDIEVPKGVKVTGKNYLGQPMVDSEDQGPHGNAAGRFWDSAKDVLTGAASGLYHAATEGPQTPEESAIENNPMAGGRFGVIANRVLIQPQVEQAKQAFEADKKARDAAAKGSPYAANQESMKSAGHALAALTPVVGPWAAQVGQQVGEQAGAGNYAGAAGTGAGNAALYVAPHVAGKVLKAVPKAVRSTGEALTKTTPSELKNMAEKMREDNEAAAQKAKDDYAKATEQHLEESAEAAHETQGREIQSRTENIATKAEALRATEKAKAEYESKVEKVRKHNNKVERQLADRAKKQEQLTKASAELDKKFADAEVKANADNDKAWNLVRKKVADTKTEVEPIQQVVRAAAAMADPTSSPIFKSILNEGEGGATFDPQGRPVVNGKVRTVIASGKEVPISDKNYAFYYEVMYGEPLPLEESGGMTNFSRLQRWYTYLNDRMYSGGRLEAGTYNALKITRDAVNDAMGKIADQAGATEDLANARRLHTEKMETFHDSPNTPATVASKAFQETTPEFVKGKDSAGRLAKVAKYDPTIAQLAEHIENLRAGIDDLPEGPLRDHLQDYPPAPEPMKPPKLSYPDRNLGPDRPVEEKPTPQEITPESYREHKEKNIREGAERVRELGVRRMINSIFYTAPAVISSTIVATLTGHPGWAAAEIGAIPVILVGSQAIANLLENPAVVKALSEINPRELETIKTLPPEDRAVFSQNFRNLVAAAKAKNIRISPAVSAFLAGASGSQPKKHKPSELRKEAEKLKPAAPEPQSMAKPYHYVYDEVKDMLVPA